MNTPPPIIPAPRRVHRKRRPTAPAPATLTLIEAEFTYVGPGATLRLEFDRAINLDGFNPSQVTVQDPGGTGWAFAGTGVIDTPDAQTVVVEMGMTGESTGAFISVSATGATGIVAVDDGATWAGVSNLELPYP